MDCRAMGVLGALVLCASWCRADIAIPPAGYDRFAGSDAVLVGRVIAIEPQDVDVAVPGSKEKTKYRVAVVQVTELIVGKKETKTLRVGFVPVNESEVPVRRRYPLLNFKLAAGDHGLMYLRQHATEKFYVSAHAHIHDFVALESEKGLQPPVERWGGKPYASELKEARHIAKMLDDPLAALRAKEQLDRFTAASQLMIRYRTPKAVKSKWEPLSEEESKLIMTALLEHRWTYVPKAPNAWEVFTMLGLTEKDGWKTPTKIENHNDLRTAVEMWYRVHPNFRIHRYVAEAAP